MQFDNHDKRLKYYQLLLERESLDNISQYSLPDGFRFVFYKIDDRDNWIEIEKSAKEFDSYEQGLEAWRVFYEGHEDELATRMVFIENEKGEKIATATAYYDVLGKDTSEAGWLHWVAVKREYQGKGLSKPLISHTLNVLKSLGYSHTKISTQTTTWVACNIYLSFGFSPIPKNAVENRDGWNMIKHLTAHPALEDFDDVDIRDFLNTEGQIV